MQDVVGSLELLKLSLMGSVFSLLSVTHLLSLFPHSLSLSLSLAAS